MKSSAGQMLTLESHPGPTGRKGGAALNGAANHRCPDAPAIKLIFIPAE
jgi:hypothetical protein